MEILDVIRQGSFKGDLDVEVHVDIDIALLAA